MAIPSFDQLENATALSLYTAQIPMREAGYEVELCVHTGNCHVDDARNVLVREFLKTDCEAFIFIDADMGWQSSDLVRLADHPGDIVGASYPKKKDEEDYPCRFLQGEIWSDENGLIEVEGIPTGFMKVQRAVFEALWEKARKYRVDGHLDVEDTAEIFERGVVNGARISGDYNFCRKARGLGFKVFADPEIFMEHVGKKTWTGTLGGYLRRKNGLDCMGLLKIREGVEKDTDIIELVQDWDNPWAASAELLKVLVGLARQAKTITECGSGLSTLVMAAANPEAKITCLEHDHFWVARMDHYCRRFGFENVNIVFCSLKDGFYDYPLDGELVVVDGPPRAVGDRSKATEYMGSPKCVVWDDRTAMEGAEIMGTQRKFAVWRPTSTLSPMLSAS